MKIKVFYPDRNGNIVFSKKDLEKLLDEVYREGYSDGYSSGQNSRYYWYPTWYGNISTTTTTTPNITYGGVTTVGGETNISNSTNYNASIPHTYTADNDGKITNIEIDLSALKYSENSVKYE